MCLEIYVFAVILLLTGPCIIYCAYLEIRTAIKKDENQGHFCQQCNRLLRKRELSWVENGALCDGIDYYCFRCNESRDIRIDIDDSKETVAIFKVSMQNQRKCSPFNTIPQYSAIIFILLALLVGLPLLCIDSFIEWSKILAVRNDPVVEGTVISREQIVYKGIIPGVDFSIQLEDSDRVVHAKTEKYLFGKIPERVKFHYSGDVNREVHLMEYEESPFGVFIICLLGTILITWPLIGFLKKEIFIRKNN